MSLLKSKAIGTGANAMNRSYPTMENTTMFRMIGQWLRRWFVVPLAMFAILSPRTASAQLAYTFQTVQTSSFSSSPSNSSLITQTFDDEVFSRTLAPGFTFNGTLHTQIQISANGFVTFGTAPAGNEYTPISSAVGYSGVIAAFAADLEPASSGGSNRRITYQQIGSEIIVQWQRVKRKGTSEYFDCGIRLNTTTGVIKLEYGGINTLDFATTHQPQVGLRGVNNNLAAGNVKNRLVGTGSETWLNSLAGSTNNSRARFTNASPSKSWVLGLNYIYTPCTVGLACSDGDACTINDQIDVNCNCVGTFQDTDSDTVCDANDGCPLDPNKIAPGLCGCGIADTDTDLDSTPDCIDACPNDPNKIAPGICGCGVSDVDTDLDNTVDCLDGCPTDPNKTDPGLCGCGVADTDTDADSTPDCNDGCPNDPNKTAPGTCGCGNPEPGSLCDDGDPNTSGDTVGGDCGCSGTPVAGCDDVSLEINTDLSGAETTWEIQDAGTSQVLCSGGPYFNGAQINISHSCCLPNGCYNIAVYDSGGDGMMNGFNGGYTLRTAAPDNRRIIDSRNNGDFGAVSQVTGSSHAFCMPMGDDRMIYTSCDKYWWRSGEYIVANDNPLVAAEWIPNAPNSAQDDDSGYEFWIYNPRGNYSFRKFRPHSVGDNFANIGSARACHMKLNNWNSALHVPEMDLMNVKVRGRVNGVNMAWGAACRMVRNETLALCPPTKLMDIPGNQFLSCGQFRQFVTNQRIHARPVSGANQYEWRFRIPAEGIEILRTSTTYFLNLGWGAGVAAPLEATKTYEVDVRAFRNGIWCGTGDPWGDVCSLTIGSPVQGGGEQMMLEQPMTTLRSWPNPNKGDGLWIQLDEIAPDIGNVTVQFFDLTGRAVHVERIAVNETVITTMIELPQAMGTGVYLMRVSVGDRTMTERLVIER